MVVAPSAEGFAAVAARETVEIVARALSRRDRVSVALAGGSTPTPVYGRIAGSYRDGLDWGRVDFFFGDERAVPPDDRRSNFRTVSESLAPLLSCASLHRIEGELGAEPAAAAYERHLRTHFGAERPRFDLVILGIGEDGHTASLFPPCPGTESPEEGLVLATTSPCEPRDRISLGFGVLAGAAHILFLARGRSKAQIVASVAGGAVDLPATRIAQRSTDVRWILDPEAAERLPRDAAGRGAIDEEHDSDGSIRGGG